MKRLGYVTAVLVLATAVATLGITAPGWADDKKPKKGAGATVFSGPNVVNPPDEVVCRIVNVDDESHAVMIQVVDSVTGTPVATSPTLTLDAGHGAGIAGPLGFGVFYCKFTLSSSADDYRANLSIFSPVFPPGDKIVNPAR